MYPIIFDDGTAGACHQSKRSLVALDMVIAIASASRSFSRHISPLSGARVLLKLRKAILACPDSSLPERHISTSYAILRTRGTLTESVVGRELRFRAANDLLGNATGRALIAASSGTGFALEGYKDHGIFAWSILDALQNADKDENGLIDIDELAASIEEMVPRIAEEAFGEKQVPQFKAPMRGFDVVSPLEAAG